MHSALLHIDSNALLIPVNRCSKRVCFWPNMAVVSIENPTYMKNFIYTSPVDSEENRWGSNLVFLSEQVNLCCVSASCLWRLLHVRLKMCSHLITNYNFFSEYFSGVAWFPTIIRPWHCKDTCLTYSCLEINLYFVPSYHLTSLGMEFFYTCIMT